jgi:chemotaxis protein CheX
MEFLMEQKIKKILARVTGETLERLAFIFTFPDDERDSDGPDPAIVGRVSFNGFFAGALLVRLSNTGIQELAVNMLGLDDDDEISSEEKQDAFKEMLNVICGNALPAIAGNQVEFSIGSPEILLETATATVLSATKPECTVRLMLEEGFCDVYFFIEGQLPELKPEIQSETIQ